MKPTKRKVESVFLIEAIGFSFIILVSWAAAFTDLPHYVFGDPPSFPWQRALVRTLVILPIWAWVHFTTRSLLRRVRYLEEFLLICSWCRKVGHDGEWLTMEEYFGSKLGKATTHGICPECSAHVISEIEKKKD